MKRQELVAYLDKILNVSAFKDYSPNGLQVEGQENISNIITGVTASLALIDAAIDKGADTIIVHHGYFWKNESPLLIGMKRQRIAKLLQHNINLLAYHLPLDAHPTLGNNAQLADHMEWLVTEHEEKGRNPLIMYGELVTPLSAAKLTQQLTQKLGRQPLHIAGNDQPISRLAWCTGAAQNYIEDAIDHKVDAYISGEISEYTTHIAKEAGIHYFAAGHHATERYGIKALGEHLAEVFAIKNHFIDIDNPV